MTWGRFPTCLFKYGRLETAAGPTTHEARLRTPRAARRPGRPAGRRGADGLRPAARPARPVAGGRAGAGHRPGGPHGAAVARLVRLAGHGLPGARPGRAAV